MTLILDSGAFIAIERNDRAMWRRLKTALLQQDVPVSHGGVVGQVWRGRARQARLIMALAGADVRPLTDSLGRAAGALLARTRKADVIDAALVLIAGDDDQIVTSDSDDIAPLARLSGRRVEIIRV